MVDCNREKRAQRTVSPPRLLLLSVKQAAEYLGVSKDIIYRWIHDGVLPHVRFTQLGNLYVDRNDLDAFVERNKFNAN